MRFDRTAWLQELVDRHGQMLFGAAYRVLGNADEAEDVLQDVFLKLLAIRARPDMAGEWGTYLRTMAVRRAIDQLRVRRRRDWRRKELNEEIAVSREPSPDSLA